MLANTALSLFGPDQYAGPLRGGSIRVPQIPRVPVTGQSTLAPAPDAPVQQTRTTNMTIAWQPGPAPFSSSTITARDSRLGDFGAILEDPEADPDLIANSFREYLANTFANTEQGKFALDAIPSLGNAPDMAIDHDILFTKHSQAAKQSFPRSYNLKDTLTPAQHRQAIAPPVLLQPEPTPAPDMQPTPADEPITPTDEPLEPLSGPTP